MEKQQAKSNNFWKTVGRIMAELLRFSKLGIVLVLLFALLSTVFSIIGPKILGNATTELVNGVIAKVQGTGGIDFDKIGSILLMVLALYVCSAVFSAVQSWIMSTISQKYSYQLRQEISQKLNRLPMGYFEKRTVGEVLSRITNDVDTLGQSLNQSFTQLITSAVTIVGVLIMMLTISPLMTVIALLMLPLSGIFAALLTKYSQKYFVEQQTTLGTINGQIEESFSGQNIIVAFNHQEDSIQSFEEQNKSLYNSAWKSQFVSGVMFPAINFVGNLGYVAVVVVGGMLVGQGVIGVGAIQAFIQYVRSFTQPISQLSQVLSQLQSMAAAAERVFEFLDEAEEEAVIHPLHITEKKGHVEFDHVAFGYDPNQLIIKDFTQNVSPGKMVAIVGPTGAGKTTMVKLLLRFYDVTSGEIRVDGYPIQQLTRDDLRDYFTMVLQDTWLFKGSIMENIRYGRLNATDEEVIAAAKSAHIHHFIATLPEGYQTELTEDAGNISQGQRQLLTIARALLADKPILILDEATSSVDTRTEILIQEAMNTLMQGRTTFVIAHRLSTIRNADMILVLKDGDIIEQGNHQELLAKQGFYSELYQSQFAEE